MKLETHWHVPERVIHQKLMDDVSLEDAKELGKVNLEYLENADGPIHFIFDTTQIGSTPLRLNLATEASKWVKHENLGWVVVIGLSGFPKFLLTVIQNTLSFRMGTASSVTEAMTWLSNQDKTLIVDTK